MMKWIQKFSDDKGMVYVEFGMSVGLLLIIIVGFAQQYVRSLDRINHYAVANQILMGPQDKMVSFDSSTGVFSALTSTSTPTYTQVVDTIGNFFLSRIPNQKFAAYIRVGYLDIRPTTGEPLSFTLTSEQPALSYIGSNASGCDDTTVGNQFVTRLAQGRLNNMMLNIQATPPADADDDTGRVGIKIYDFKLGTTRYRQYAEVMPFIFIYMCSTPVNFVYSQATDTFHTIAPRRPIN